MRQLNFLLIFHASGWPRVMFHAGKHSPKPPFQFLPGVSNSPCQLAAMLLVVGGSAPRPPGVSPSGPGAVKKVELVQSQSDREAQRVKITRSLGSRTFSAIATVDAQLGPAAQQLGRVPQPAADSRHNRFEPIGSASQLKFQLAFCCAGTTGYVAPSGGKGGRRRRQAGIPPALQDAR